MALAFDMKRRPILRTLLGAAMAVPSRAATDEPYPIFDADAGLYRKALREATIPPLGIRPTGLTVPHHLLAARLIAGTLRLASKHRYERLVILCPDHFSRSPLPFATTRRPFLTAFGRVPVDAAFAGRLLESSEMVAESSLFAKEHGLQALLPFVAKLFPDTPVVPVACGIRTPVENWKAMAGKLAALIDDKTLLVQSTDFSHYLTAREAARRDAETLRMLAVGDPAGVEGLVQPDHCDSRAALWIQMTLQRERFGARPAVVENANAIEFGGPPDCPRTTSYLTMAWTKESIPAASLPGQAFYFGGDFFCGRHMAERLARPGQAERFVKAVRSLTYGRPLIVNFEGVLLPEPPEKPAGPYQLWMDPKVALPLLEKLGVKAVTLANNHSGDYGEEGRKKTRDALEGAGLKVLGQGEVADLGFFRLGAVTDLDNTPRPRANLVSAKSFETWKADSSAKPIFAFLHSGREYHSEPDARSIQVAALAAQAGAALVVGCHPHRPTAAFRTIGGALWFPSMGNLLFDQKDVANSGGLVEVRIFAQGTWTARWLPLPNFHADAG